MRLIVCMRWRGEPEDSHRSRQVIAATASNRRGQERWHEVFRLDRSKSRPGPLPRTVNPASMRRSAALCYPRSTTAGGHDARGLWLAVPTTNKHRGKPQQQPARSGCWLPDVMPVVEARLLGHAAPSPMKPQAHTVFEDEQNSNTRHPGALPKLLGIRNRGAHGARPKRRPRPNPTPAQRSVPSNWTIAQASR
jgi:hypothetical protein